MVTKRTPIARQMATPQITREALRIWRQMSRLRCRCGPYPDPTKWWGREQCASCAKWWSLHSALAHEIPHKPWHWPLVTPITRYPDFDREAGMFVNTFRPRQGNDRMRELERALRAGAKDMRARARVGKATTNVDDVDVTVGRDPTADHSDSGPSAPSSRT
jgi:hypothetical protein